MFKIALKIIQLLIQKKMVYKIGCVLGIPDRNRHDCGPRQVQVVHLQDNCSFCCLKNPALSLCDRMDTVNKQRKIHSYLFFHFNSVSIPKKVLKKGP